MFYILFSKYNETRVMTHSTQTTDEIKSRILDSAIERFGKYGFGKTTLAEIAADCGMTAGNLYRYFPGKLDIGAACAGRFIAEAERLLRQVVQRQGLTPVLRLEAFVLEKLRFTADQMRNQPAIHELVTYIYRERRDLIDRHLEVQHSLLAEILAEGNRTGEFHLPGVLAGARLVHAATTKYHDPHCIQGQDIQAMEEEARAVVALLTQGLKGA